MEAVPSSTWFKIQQVTIRDTPDFLGCVQGIFVAWELKKGLDGSDVRKGQLWRLYRVIKAGGWGRLVYPENFDEELQFLYDLPNIIRNRPPCPTIGEYYESNGFIITSS